MSLPNTIASMRLDLTSGHALRAGVFRCGATEWRDESMPPSLKVILLNGWVNSRIEDRVPLTLRGPVLCLAWNPGQGQGADAFKAGVDSDFLQELDPTRPGADRPVVWHATAGREARRIAAQICVCRYEGAARGLYLAAKNLDMMQLPRDKDGGDLGLRRGTYVGGLELLEFREHAGVRRTRASVFAGLGRQVRRQPG